GAAAAFRARYLAFIVDKCQGVNALHQSVIDRWLGDRLVLCVVGDDYQSIYAFTSASPDYLIEMTKHHPDAAVVHLVRNYRSSPQVLDLANRLVPSLGGVPKELRPTRRAGPEPITRGFADPAREAAFVV